MTRRNFPVYGSPQHRRHRWPGHHGGRVGEGFGRISADARLPQRHQDLAFGTELDDHASLLVFAGKFLEVFGGRGPGVGDPHIAVAIDMDAMRPDEQAAAKAADLLPGLIKKVDRVSFCAKAARGCSGRAPVGGTGELGKFDALSRR